MESAFFISAVLLAVIPYTYQIPVVLPYNSAVTQNAEPTLESTRFRTEEAPSVATTTVHLPKDGTITASSTIEPIPADENQDPKSPPQSSQKRHKRSDELSDPLVYVSLCLNTPKSLSLNNLVLECYQKSKIPRICQNFKDLFRKILITAYAPFRCTPNLDEPTTNCTLSETENQADVNKRLLECLSGYPADFRDPIDSEDEAYSEDTDSTDLDDTYEEE